MSTGLGPVMVCVGVSCDEVVVVMWGGVCGDGVCVCVSMHNCESVYDCDC